MPSIAWFLLAALSAHALEPFQEQMPLQMTAPDISKEQSAKWIPLLPNSQETVIKKSSIPGTKINELIKTQVQKKMQMLLKPLNDDQDEQ